MKRMQQTPHRHTHTQVLAPSCAIHKRLDLGTHTLYADDDTQDFHTESSKIPNPLLPPPPLVSAPGAAPQARAAGSLVCPGGHDWIDKS